jgi:hypothetical protein
LQRQASINKRHAAESDDELEQDAESLKLTLEFKSYMRKLAQHKLIRKPIIEFNHPKSTRARPEPNQPTRKLSTCVTDISADIQPSLGQEKVQSLLASYDSFKAKLA